MLEPTDDEVDALIHEKGNLTLEEIAQRLGITRERARQIISNALTKLRRACRERGIDANDIPTKETTWDRLESS